jgi:hypothetical protein
MSLFDKKSVPNELSENLATILKESDSNSQDSFKDANELELFQGKHDENNSTEEIQKIINDVKSDEKKRELEKVSDENDKDKGLLNEIKLLIESITSTEKYSLSNQTGALSDVTRNLLNTPFIDYFKKLNQTEIYHLYDCIEKLDYKSKKMVHALLISLKHFDNYGITSDAKISNSSPLSIGILVDDNNDRDSSITETQAYNSNLITNTNFKEVMDHNETFKKDYSSLFRKLNRMFKDCIDNKGIITSETTLNIQESQGEGEGEGEGEPKTKKTRRGENIGGKKSRKNKKGSKKTTKKSKKTTKKQKRSKRKH